VNDIAKRLRLVLGGFADASLGRPLDSDAALADMDRHLAFLYDRAYRTGRGLRSERAGGLGPSALRTPDWLAHVRELFPKRCLSVIERDAVVRFGMTEILRDPATIAADLPPEELLRLLVQFRSQIPQTALEDARRMAREAVARMHEALASTLRPALTGALDRTRRSRFKISQNLDALRTVRENLKHFDPERGILAVETLVFRARRRRHADFRVILLVDQSGSMLGSVIQSAVVGAIFASVPDIDLRLLAFDTQVADMTEIAADPVEVLFSVQLGGGTRIERAVSHAATLVEHPQRTMILIVSDFYEGGPARALYAKIQDLLDAGVKVLGLLALGAEASPEYNRQIVGTLSSMGMPAAAMTPGELAEWMCQAVRAGGP
jgi:hypothetical protein